MPGTIACDESGSEGVNLIGANTDVFAHAGVRVDVGAAADCVGELRDRIGSPAVEYKANHLLRTKNRAALVWFLGPTGPLVGRAGVVLVDKALFVTGKVVDLLVDQVPYPDCLARRPDSRTPTLHHDGLRLHGPRWVEFLQSFTALLRTSQRRGPGVAPSEFFAQRDVLSSLARVPRYGGPLPAGPSPLASNGLEHPQPGSIRLEPPRIDPSPASEHLTELRDQLLADPSLVPPLDPLMPALVDTVTHWHPTTVIHDEQPSLTPARLATLLGPTPDIRFVDSRADPRVQLADFLAGVTRRLAEDALHHRGDPELTALLRPYLLPQSIWAAEL
ncbi:hypothetical protein QRX50_17955 [Amycolatopsis carbonis]|uniref:DUF3800 domain-containing protein n=1 Tax=Amycolatopsis carbonis TaxID=715471 RepID=A0A9Y2N111_9PSEU|nr:DUF3800 domain-containing protein [Amycolatopsis sp. 2-15]WIX82512.1 hypothetical protein QRX50_17955 [Amycolatopsis sp. 2-15]